MSDTPSPGTTEGWQPINTAPIKIDCLFYQEARELFPLYTVGPFFCIGSIDDHQRFSPACIGGYEWECDMEKPTHWMPLPEPPK